MEKELLKIMKALADGHRLKIFHLLYGRDLCVCEVMAILKMNQPNASRHLSRMREAGLIHSAKKGQFVLYRMDPKLLTKYPFLETLLQTIMKDPGFRADRVKLEKVSCVIEGAPSSKN